MSLFHKQKRSSPEPSERVARALGLASSEVVLDERPRRQDLDLVLLGLHDLHRLWALWLPLALRHRLALRLRLLLLLVLLDASQESLLAARLPQVLGAHVDALEQLAVANHLLHFDAYGVAVHVEHDT